MDIQVLKNSRTSDNIKYLIQHINILTVDDSDPDVIYYKYMHKVHLEYSKITCILTVSFNLYVSYLYKFQQDTLVSSDLNQLLNDIKQAYNIVFNESINYINLC